MKFVTPFPVVNSYFLFTKKSCKIGKTLAPEGVTLMDYNMEDAYVIK